MSPRRHAHIFVLVLITAAAWLSAGAAAAANDNGAASTDSARARTTSATPPGRADTTAPTAPAALTASAVGQTSMTLAWGASTDAVGVAGYTVYENGVALGTTTSLTYDLSGLTCGTTYSFAVDAYDAAGNRSAAVSTSVPTAGCPAPTSHLSASAPATTSASTASAQQATTSTHGEFAAAPDGASPTAPAGLRVTAAGQTSLTLAWGASTDAVGVVGYIVSANGATQATTSSLSYTLSSLGCGTVYLVAVVAYDTAGNRSAPATISAPTAACTSSHPSGSTATTVTSAPDPSSPSSPRWLTVTAAGQTTLSLAWTAPTNATGVVGYTVYKDAVTQGTTTGLTYDLSSLKCGTTYAVAVDAYDAAGNHSVPAVVSASTAACASTPVSSAGNVWVSPSGSDATCARGDASRPCASFNRAYQLAQSGDLVSVGAGNYAPQRIAYDSTKASSPVTFSPAGGSVSLDRLDVGQAQLDTRAPQHVVVRDMSIGYTAVWDGAVDIVLQNLTGRGFDVISGGSGWPLPDNVRILGGSFGPCEAVAQNGNCTNRMIGSNIVADGVSIHDVTSNDQVRFHTDGIFVRGCQGCAIRNSTFRTNDVTNIRIQNCCGLPQNQNLVIENNSFGQPNGGRNDGIDIDTATPGLIIRSNVFDPNTGPSFDGSGYSGERLIQNKMKYLGPCVPNVSYENDLVKAFSAYTGNVLCGTDSWGSWGL